MLNARSIGTTENASSIRNTKAVVGSEQKVHKLRAKALGDVQNTLHSRPSNFITPSKNFPVKTTIKSGIQMKGVSHENDFLSKFASEKKVNATPSKSAIKSLLSSPDFEEEMFETHHHILCEQDQQSHIKDYFKEYKFSEVQIKDLAQSVKCFATPLSIPFYYPCEDISIPDTNTSKEKDFLFSDILKDLVLPEIPPIQ